MVVKARRLHLTWLLNLGICIMAGTIPVGLIMALFRVVGEFQMVLILATGVLLGAGIILVRLQLSGRYDPNSQDLEFRKNLGQTRSIPRADLEKMTQDAEKREN